jgi:hypothetical protein
VACLALTSGSMGDSVLTPPPIATFQTLPTQAPTIVSSASIDPGQPRGQTASGVRREGEVAALDGA